MVSEWLMPVTSDAYPELPTIPVRFAFSCFHSALTIGGYMSGAQYRSNTPIAGFMKVSGVLLTILIITASMRLPASNDHVFAVFVGPLFA